MAWTNSTELVDGCSHTQSACNGRAIDSMSAELEDLDEVKSLVVRGLRVGARPYAEVAARSARSASTSATSRICMGSLTWRSRAGRGTLPSHRSECGAERRIRPKAPLDLAADATTDALQLLLKDIGKARLLTARQEVEALAKRIERGDLEAKQKMVESNLRLVVSIAPRTTAIRAYRFSI